MFDPKSKETIGYHLFFLPSGEFFDSLQGTINTLAEKYDGPKFEPHVTLLARITKTDEVELIEKTKKLTSITEPFEIKLKEIFTEETYFRALYYGAEHNAKLEKCHQKALKIFGVQDINVYMPHLSLYYGNVSQSIKDEMIGLLSLPHDTKFLVDKIYLYRTEGRAENWARVGEYIL